MFINKIFRETGKMTRLASDTYFPEIKDSPHNSSIALANGIMYFEATNPTWNALKDPVASGSGANFRKKLTEAKINNAPNNTLTIVVAIFIKYNFKLLLKVTK